MNKHIIEIYIKENFNGKITPSVGKKVQDSQPRIYSAIMDYTKFLPDSVTFPERCYNLEYDLTERATCSCGKVLKFKNYSDGYGDKCSKTCKG